MVAARKAKSEYESDKSPHAMAKMKSAMVEDIHDGQGSNDPQLQKWNEMQAQLGSILTTMGKSVKCRESGKGKGNPKGKGKVNNGGKG